MARKRKVRGEPWPMGRDVLVVVVPGDAKPWQEGLTGVITEHLVSDDGAENIYRVTLSQGAPGTNDATHELIVAESALKLK